MRGRKLSRMKRGKVYCLQLPPDEPTLPACDNIDTKGNRQKASWFLFVVNNIENMVRLSLKTLCDFLLFFKLQSRLEAKLEEGRGVETELGVVRRFVVSIICFVALLFHKLVYLFVHFSLISAYILFSVMFCREREGLAGENTRLRHRQVSLSPTSECLQLC